MKRYELFLVSSGGWRPREGCSSTVKERLPRPATTRFEAAGASLCESGRRTGSFDIRAAFYHARTGLPGDARGKGWLAKARSRDRTPTNMLVAEQVRLLRDEEMVSIAEIAGLIGITEATVAKAYSHARPDLAKGPGKRGNVAPRLGGEKCRESFRRLESGETPQQVASAVGCCRMTVYRIRKAGRPDPA